MRDKGVVATLLPTTAYVLRIEPPPARKLIDSSMWWNVGEGWEVGKSLCSTKFMHGLHFLPYLLLLLILSACLLSIHMPDARPLLQPDVAVALGSDFNPNAHCMSMPHVMNLACVLMRMTANEALCAATINAAGTRSSIAPCVTSCCLSDCVFGIQGKGRYPLPLILNCMCICFVLAPQNRTHSVFA
jgi:hypothetical protein